MAVKIMAMAPSSERPKWWWWAFIAAAAAIFLTLPEYADLGLQLDLSKIFIFGLLALSMSFLWGFGGMLSFGQTAFFGIGGYTYAVLSLNTGETTGSIFVAILFSMIFAAILGYFLIYGRISAIYFSIITLVATLVLEKAMRSTSSEYYTIGDVQLRGQNGISLVPSLQVPWNPSVELFIDGVFYLSVVVLILVYVGLRLALTTKFGRILVCIRENERRTELLGYDSRRYQLGAFVIAGGVAGLSGALFSVWNNFIAPEVMNLESAANVVIWVIVGGKATLIGPIVGTAAIEYMTTWLGQGSWVGQITLILGPVLIVFVMVFKEGIVPTIGMGLALMFESARGNSDGRATMKRRIWRTNIFSKRTN